MTGATEVMIVAGEASGDLHGGRLMTELVAKRGDLRFFGLGGEEMTKSGLDAVAHSREIAVVGITEVLRVLRRARQIYRLLIDEAARRRPRLAILIDAPDFNLRLARGLKELGIPVVYYVSPQIWAWRRGRVRVIAERVRRMLVLFPFELDFYADHGVEVRHVGHPLVDEVPELQQAWDREAARPSGERRLVLLPGSRDSEVERLLPIMLDSAERLTRNEAVSETRLVVAPTVSEELIRSCLERCRADVLPVREDRYRAIADSHLALCASGTATLEVGLLGTPMIVLYRVGWWTAQLGRLLIDVPHISLVNLVLGGEVVPELVQTGLEVDRVVALGEVLLSGGEETRAMRGALSPLRSALGSSGATARAATEVLAVLEEVELEGSVAGGAT